MVICGYMCDECLIKPILHVCQSLKRQVQELSQSVDRLQTLCGVSKTHRTDDDSHSIFKFNFHNCILFLRHFGLYQNMLCFNYCV